MKVKKFENVQSESGSMGCKWSNLNPPGTETPLSHPYWKLQEFPFSHNWPSGVIRMGSQYESEKVWKCSEWIWLNGLQMVQFEPPRHWNPSVSSILGKGNSPNSQYGWYWGVWVPGAFKLDHLQPFKPVSLWTISNSFTFILGANSYYPRGLIMGKGKFFQLPI